MSISRALVAESHPLCRTGLAAMLRVELGIGSVVEVGRIDDALDWLNASPSGGLMTVDPALPGLSAIGGVRGLRQRFPEIRLVVIGPTGDRADVIGALDAGAHGYIAKNLAREEMVHAFGSVLGGHIYVPPLVTDLARSDAAVPGCTSAPLSGLTERQREVLAHLATGKSNKEIARALRITESTVKVHVAAAFRLLGVHNRVGAVAAMQSRSPQPNAEVERIVSQVNYGRRATDFPRILAAG